MIHIIKKELDDFRDKSITITDGYDFNQKDTLNTIYLYYNSKYETGDIDDQGDKKYFDNINRNPCNVGTKAIDFDTKHIRILTSASGDPLKTWFFERDLKFWMKDQGFGSVLNRIFHELPIFGSVVLKVVNGKPYFVDLRNFAVEQNADTLDKSNYIIEIHNYTPVEFRRIGKKKKWQNVDEVINAFRENRDGQYVRVFERYGEVEEDGTYSYKRVLIADVGEDKEDDLGETIPHEGVLLDETAVDKHPYREFHWEKIPGRWLGIGRVEILFDPQIRVNEISNQQVKSSYWSTLRLWQCRDEGVSRNLLTSVDNGEILYAEQPINQIDMADRNLAYYNQEIERWMGNRDELTFSYDVTRGERLPSGTPLGSAKIAAGMAGSYFDQIRENIAEVIKQMLYDVIIPWFEKENNTEHMLRIAGEDLDELNRLLVSHESRNELLRYVVRTGKIPSNSEYEILKTIVGENIRKGKEKLIKIPKKFYKNLKYKIDIVITGESIDVGERASARFAVLQAITTDPTMLTDPNKRKLLFGVMEDYGISPTDFDLGEMPAIENMSQRMPQRMPQQVSRGAGGGVSRPVMTNVPVSGATQRTI